MSYIANNNNKNVFGLCAENHPIVNDKHIKYHEMYHFYEPLIRTVDTNRCYRPNRTKCRQIILVFNDGLLTIDSHKKN